MSNSKDALRNIAMLHMTTATWRLNIGPVLKATNVVQSPAGPLAAVYTASSDKLICTLSLVGDSFTITLFEGEEALAFFQEKLAEVEEREADVLLKKILQETSSHEQEDLWYAQQHTSIGSLTQPTTTYTSTYFREYAKNKRAMEYYKNAVTSPTQEDSFQKQIEAIRQKYKGQPSKRKK